MRMPTVNILDKGVKYGIGKLLRMVYPYVLFLITVMIKILVAIGISEVYFLLLALVPITVGVIIYNCYKSFRVRRSWAILLLSLMLSVMTVALPFIRTWCWKFFLFESTYVEKSEEYYQYALSNPIESFVPVEGAKVLGRDVILIRDEEDILVCFVEAYTLFDCGCFVRKYTDKEVSELIPDSPFIREMKDNWYYVNLY